MVTCAIFFERLTVIYQIITNFAKTIISMKQFINKCIASTLPAVILMASGACTHSNEWTIKGTIEGADGQTLLLEASDNGHWYALDSITLDSDGAFSISQDPRGYPDIFRLRLGNKMLYFPIDSIETVTVNSKASAFDTDYTLDGSKTAQDFMNVDRKLQSAVNSRGAASIATDSLLKRELGNIVLSDGAGVISYYLINKKYGGNLIFNPANRSDLRVIGAVANAFTRNRPNDPRTAYLKKLYLSSRKAEGNVPVDTIRAKEVGIFEIDLYDPSGNKQSLTAQVAKGGVTLLNFTVLDADGAPEFNRRLYNVYKKYHDRGFEIFQVGMDESESTWRQAARNLPWISVYNSPVTGARYAMNYNVTDIPVSFIINRRGEIVERIDDISTLDAAIARHL